MPANIKWETIWQYITDIGIPLLAAIGAGVLIFLILKKKI